MSVEAGMVLAPVSRMWRDDEVIAFGDETGDKLQEQGREVFNKLFTQNQGG